MVKIYISRVTYGGKKSVGISGEFDRIPGTANNSPRSLLETSYEERELNKPVAIRDQSISMGIRDQEICNGTIGYLCPSVIRGATGYFEA